MVGLGILCGVAIVTVFEITRPVIARNQRAALEQAVFEVLPAAASSVSFRLGTGGQFVPAHPEDPDLPAVHAGYDASGQLVGIAVEAQGVGYQDRIRLLYGYDAEREAIVGLRFLESRETPGLGDRVESDPRFLENFLQLDVSLTPDLSRLVHPIEYVAPGEKTQPWEIDGLSGATITSTAVARTLRESAAEWMPRLRANLTDFSRDR
jgi:electron transport complex protein RnfG